MRAARAVRLAPLAPPPTTCTSGAVLGLARPPGPLPQPPRDRSRETAPDDLHAKGGEELSDLRSREIVLFADAGGGASAGRVQVASGSCKYSELSGTTVCMGTAHGLMRDVFEAGAHG